MCLDEWLWIYCFQALQRTLLRDLVKLSSVELVDYSKVYKKSC